MSRRSSNAADKSWLNLRYHKDGTIMKPDELEKYMTDPPGHIERDVLDRIHGSMIGMALGDALGAFVEFRPHEYMLANPVDTLKGGGTWGLKKGQFTDDTSMGLCLANSLVVRQDYVPYDQLVRYKWWHQNGYMSSTGSCFDIGAATRQSLVEFERRQKQFAKEYKLNVDELDFLSDPKLLDKFDVNCSKEGVAGNGALMRLAPVPLFFYRDPIYAVEYSGHSGEITHGDKKAYDACRYYGALIVAAVRGESKDELLNDEFYQNHKDWFSGKQLHSDIEVIAGGSYKKGGYEKGIRGKGYIVSALEAALWAFWSDEGSYKNGVLAAVNLGDDTDTTAAIYGQLAGAHYGHRNLPEKWAEQVYAKKFIECLSKWIVYEGERWALKQPTIPTMIVESPSKFGGASPFEEKTNSNTSSLSEKNRKHGSKTSTEEINAQPDSFSKFEQLTGFPPSQRPRRNTVVNRKSDSDQQTESTRPESAKQRQRIFSNENLTSCPEVCTWIRKMGKEYAVYVDVFKQHDVNGYWLLNQITDNILKNYGIENTAHRQTILANIKQLKNESDVKFVPEQE